MVVAVNMILIIALIVVALLIGFGYLFFYKKSAQKRLTGEKIKTNLPTPLNFILITLLIASFIGNILFMMNRPNSNRNFNQYNYSIMGKLRSEYQYIEDEVIKGLRPEYIVISKEQNDFIIYYAKIIDVLKDQSHFLPNYIIYIKYVGEDVIGEGHHIRRTSIQGKTKSAIISQYKSDDIILILSSQELDELELIGEIKYIEWLGKEESYYKKPLNEVFDEAELLYYFRFKIKDSNFE